MKLVEIKLGDPERPRLRLSPSITAEKLLASLKLKVAIVRDLRPSERYNMVPRAFRVQPNAWPHHTPAPVVAVIVTPVKVQVNSVLTSGGLEHGSVLKNIPLDQPFEKITAALADEIQAYFREAAQRREE